MKNETYTFAPPDEEGRKIIVSVQFYLDDEEAMKREVEDIVNAYNSYMYADWDDMERDCIDCVKRHLKYRVFPTEN